MNTPCCHSTRKPRSSAWTVSRTPLQAMTRSRCSQRAAAGRNRSPSPCGRGLGGGGPHGRLRARCQSPADPSPNPSHKGRGSIMHFSPATPRRAIRNFSGSCTTAGRTPQQHRRHDEDHHGNGQQHRQPGCPRLDAEPSVPAAAPAPAGAAPVTAAHRFAANCARVAVNWRRKSTSSRAPCPSAPRAGRGKCAAR